MAKRRWLILVFFMGLLLWGYLCGFALVKTSDRKNNDYKLPTSIKENIKVKAPFDDYKAAVAYSLKLTSQLLRFTKKNRVDEGQANCVGYAIVCSSICNYALEISDLPHRSKPVVGYVTFCGINLCPILQRIVPENYKSIVKDHDFVELNLDDTKLYFDASLYDFHIYCTTSVKKWP